MKHNATICMAILFAMLSACSNKSSNPDSGAAISTTSPDQTGHKDIVNGKDTSATVSPTIPDTSHLTVRCKVITYDRTGGILKALMNSFKYDSRGRLSTILINDTPRISYAYLGDSIVETNATSTNIYIVNSQGYLLRDKIGGTRTDSYEYDKDGYARKWYNSMSASGGMTIMEYTVTHQWKNGNMISSISDRKGIVEVSYDYYPNLPYQAMAPVCYTQGRQMKNLMKGVHTNYRGSESGKVLTYQFDKAGRISQYSISQTDDTKTVYELEYFKAK